MKFNPCRSVKSSLGDTVKMKKAFLRSVQIGLRFLEMCLVLWISLLLNLTTTNGSLDIISVMKIIVSRSEKSRFRGPINISKKINFLFQMMPNAIDFSHLKQLIFQHPQFQSKNQSFYPYPPSQYPTPS